MARNATKAALGDAIPLLGGPYQSRSLIAGGQRCVNLYPETYTPEAQSAAIVTHFLTPGLTLKGTAPVAFPFRRLGLYRATNGELFAVLGGSVYYIDILYNFTLLGTITVGVSPVSMRDNGNAIVIVDGGTTAWAIDLSAHTFGVVGAGFQGADKVAFIDTYFVFNLPDTNQFYISLSNVTYSDLVGGTAFDALDIAAKTGASDPIQTIMDLRGELWLIGTLTTEVWANTGGADFAFERIPGALIEHGALSKHSVAKTDSSLYFLMQDLQGRAIVAKSAGYALERISAYAMEEEMQGYSELADAFAYTRQSEGHAFYVLTFPTADKTWVIELASGQIHEWESMDTNGNAHRHRSNGFAAAYGQNLVGDYENGRLYSLDPAVFTEQPSIGGSDLPIRRLRSFPHIVDSGNQLICDFFIADIGAGQALDPTDEASVSLRVSQTRGASWGNYVIKSMGQTGHYEVLPRWNKLGKARDFVFELSWAVDAKTWLNGGWAKFRRLAS